MFCVKISSVCIDDIDYKYKGRIILFCYNLILDSRSVFVFMLLYIKSLIASLLCSIEY